MQSFASISNRISMGGAPTLGAMLGGSYASQDLLAAVNASSQQHFGVIFSNQQDPLTQHFNQYMQQVIQPMQEARVLFRNTLAHVIMPDRYIPVVELQHLNCIPEQMQLPILMYPPVHALHQAGKIAGFGIDPNWTQTEDVYGRLIDNGRVTFDGADEEKEFIWTFKSTDPDMEWDDLDAIEETRVFIQELLDNTNFDPTDYPNHIKETD